MYKNISIKGLNVWQVLFLIFLYIFIKILLAYGLLEILFLFIDDVLLEVELGEFLSATFLLLLLIIIFKKHLKLSEENYIQFPKIKLLLLSLIAVIALRVLNDPFFRYENILFKEPIFSSSEAQSVKFTGDLILKASYTILIVPVFEELLFRKIIFKSLLKKYNNLLFAVIFSSLVFSLTHLSLSNIIPTFLLGIIVAYIYNKTNNIWYPIIFHVLYNILWFLILINQDLYWLAQEKLNFSIAYWVSVVIGIGLILIVLNQYRKLR